MGTVAAMDLSKSAEIEVGIGDVDLERARAVARIERSFRAFKVDVSDIEETAKVLRGYDAVINASWYQFNLLVMKACFRAGCYYNDLGGLFHVTRKQLALNNEAKRAGITSIVGGGESPGITNVMSASCAEDLSTVETIKVYAGAKEGPKAKTFANLTFPFAVSTIIDEYSKKPVEFLNGKFVELPPLSGAEEVEFPKPVGRNQVHYSIHSEPATLPFSIKKGVRNVEFKLGVSEAMLNTLQPLIEMGLTSDEIRIKFDGVNITPKSFIVSFLNKMKPPAKESERTVSLKTVARGLNGRKNRVVESTLVCGPDRKGQVKNATAFLTGIAGSIFAQMLASGHVEQKGVLAPESAAKPLQFFNELKNRGVSVKKNVKKAAS